MWPVRVFFSFGSVAGLDVEASSAAEPAVGGDENDGEDGEDGDENDPDENDGLLPVELSDSLPADDPSAPPAPPAEPEPMSTSNAASLVPV